MKRLFYSKLLSWSKKNDRKPLMLKGVRQSGKTYLLQEFGKNEFPNFHYFNFEKEPALVKVFSGSLDPKHLIQELSFYQNKPINIKEDLVIFDEIQAIPTALTSLKYFNEEMKELALCTAGSLLGVTLNQASFPVGKVETEYLYPLNFIEFLYAIDEALLADLLEGAKEETVIPLLAHERLFERLKWYFIVGGLPEAVLAFRSHLNDLFVAFEKARNAQKQLIGDYYSDIAKHSGKVNAMHIDRILRSIPTQLASSVDGSAKRYRFQGVIEGIDRYSRLATAFDWLENAGMIFKVPILHSISHPLSANVEEARFKLFLFDVGLLGAISGLSPKTIIDYTYGTYKGYFAENFVLQEFMSTEYKENYSWQEGHAEVEFVKNIDGDILPIEVKSGNVTHAKSLQKFVEKYSSKYRTIISGKELMIDKRNEIYNYPLYLAQKFPLRKS